MKEKNIYNLILSLQQHQEGALRGAENYGFEGNLLTSSSSSSSGGGEEALI